LPVNVRKIAEKKVAESVDLQGKILAFFVML
jgi:hypothetical protein